MELVDLPGIRKYRAALVDRLREECAFTHVLMRAELGDRAAIHDFHPAEQACSAYADAVDGKLEMEPFWRNLVESRCADNGDPIRCKFNEHMKASSSDGSDRMRLYVLRFGWSNCAIEKLAINAKEAEFKRAQAEILKEFQKRFKVSRSECGAQRSYD